MRSSSPTLAALRRLVPRALVVGAGCIVAFWCWTWWRASTDRNHRHVPGTHGGIIVAVGHDHYHVEAVIAQGGILKLFTLGQDQTRVTTVPVQAIAAYVRSPETVEAVPIILDPQPQPGDPPGKTSAFEGRLPLELVGSQLMVIVPSIAMDSGRYRFGFMTRDEHAGQMPRKVVDEAERRIYLTAGGKLTAADIKANGSTTPSQRYRGFRSEHDMHPVAGETICPITQTKANPKCTWIVGGKQYAFCCPPCIDEFVKLAKEQPERIQDPSAYVAE